jgi:Cd2+/Zn2+-exporting ATPase
MVIAVCGALALRQWFEGASVVFLFALAQWLEARTLERARQAIRALVELSPREAIVKRNGVEHRAPVETIVVGAEIVVRPGDKIPLDGRVLAGRGDVNEAPITGESLPVDKGPGDEVYAGTINGRGSLDLEVIRVGRDTRLARIIHLVEAAQARRAPVQSFVDRFARIYTPVVIALAAIIAVVPPVLFAADPATWIYRSLVLLVIACPCALVISTPVSIVAALSAAARNGVLIKGGVHLERLADVRVVAFDKTGTLTRGEPRVSDVIAVDGLSPTDVLRYAAAVEARSEHALARAITRLGRAHDAEPRLRFGRSLLLDLLVYPFDPAWLEQTWGSVAPLLGEQALAYALDTLEAADPLPFGPSGFAGGPGGRPEDDGDHDGDTDPGTASNRAHDVLPSCGSPGVDGGSSARVRRR